MIGLLSEILVVFAVLALAYKLKVARTQVQKYKHLLESLSQDSLIHPEIRKQIQKELR